MVLRGSVEPINATDLRWPALVHRPAPRHLTGLATERLEFETAAFFPAAGGEAAWVRSACERSEVWRDRLRLAADSVAARCRVLGG